jgi:ribosomal-protein-alanine N-acetyltransferase
MLPRLLDDSVFDAFPQFETERLLLRSLALTDAPDVFAALSDVEVVRFHGTEPFTSIERAEESIRRNLEMYAAREGFRWAITLKGQGRAIGSCGYHYLDRRNRRTDLGYELQRAYWGAGIMTEALRAIIPFGFERFGLNRIQALVEPANSASRRLLHKLGFQEEGTLRQYDLGVRTLDDVVIYSLLSSDPLP